jgi:hypothetical protein
MGWELEVDQGSKLIFGRKTYYARLKRQKRKLFLILLKRKNSATTPSAPHTTTKNTVCNLT